MSLITDIIKVYLDNLFKVSANTELELEAKFGTRGIKSINKIDYGNVIKTLLSHGFVSQGTNNIYSVSKMNTQTRIQVKYACPN